MQVNTMKKLTGLLLTLIMAFSVSEISFNPAVTESVSAKVDRSAESSLYNEPSGFNLTDIPLVENHSTDYVIVIPKNATSMEKYAAEELRYFLKESTACEFGIITDENLSADNAKKYLSVGQTSLLKAQSDIKIDYETFGESGPTVIRKGNSVYMCGAHNYGTLYSVYKFLEYQIGYTAYATDCVYFERYINLKLLDFKYQYVPTIGKTNGHEAPSGTGSLKDLARMYMIGEAREDQQELFDGLYWDGYFCHTNAFFVDQSKYPELYKNNQICYTSSKALEVFSDSIFKLFYESPGKDRINLGVNDWPTSCDCGTCVKETAKYNGGGVLIRFCNKVAENVENRFRELGIVRKIELVPLIYYNYITPPVKKDANGNYVAIDDTVYPRKGDVSVGLMYTPILSCYHHSYENPCDVNEGNKEDILGWKAIYDGFFYMYSYGSTFPGKYTYFDNMQYLAEQFRWYHDNGIRFNMVFEQGTGASITILAPLKMYVRSKLGWNPMLNLEDVVNDFCAHYYGPAGKSVAEYLKLLTDQWQWIYKYRSSYCLLPLTGSQNPDYWPRQILDSFESCILTGMANIENSKYDESQKAIFRERLNKELFVIRYNQYVKYLGYYSQQEQESLIGYINENIVKEGYDPINKLFK